MTALKHGELLKATSHYKKLTEIEAANKKTLQPNQFNKDNLRKDRLHCVNTFLLVSVISVLLGAFLYVQYTCNWKEAFNFTFHIDYNEVPLENQCTMQLVESIPQGLVYEEGSPRFRSTYEAWNLLLNLTTKSLNIGSFYWTLRGVDVIEHPSAAPGEHIFQRLLDNAVNGSAKYRIRIAQSMPSSTSDDKDTKLLAESGAAEVRTVDFTRLLGSGILHTKAWIVDDQHFYLGSANMDWRSLTQVKELGILATNCPLLAQDLNKIFEAYWYLGANSTEIPDRWPSSMATKVNAENPLLVHYNDSFNMWTYLASSPPPLSAQGRTHDLEAILNTIHTARHFISISVMDYYPLQLYTKHWKYWPYIDDALRAAAVERGVAIKLLISWWKHSRSEEDYFLRSLSSLSQAMPNVDIQIKRFVVPTDADLDRIPFGRVNHNKYMVTDNTAYIGTSNWSGDYFIDTAGIGLVLNDADVVRAAGQSTIRTDLLSIFQRDWNSKYAKPLKE